VIPRLGGKLIVNQWAKELCDHLQNKLLNIIEKNS
jgi:hypothetical protein